MSSACLTENHHGVEMFTFRLCQLHGTGDEKLKQGEAIELISQMNNLQDLLETVLNKLPPKSDRV
jgi:hypothetical protein